MPFYRHPQTWVPIFIDAERRSVKNGIHHAVFTRNWGKYVGDWKTDKKEGRLTDKLLLWRIFMIISRCANCWGKGDFLSECKKLRPFLYTWVKSGSLQSGVLKLSRGPILATATTVRAKGVS